MLLVLVVIVCILLLGLLVGEVSCGMVLGMAICFDCCVVCEAELLGCVACSLFVVICCWLRWFVILLC